MNTPRIISALGYLDDDLLEEAASESVRKSGSRFHYPAFMRNWSKMGVAAACICLVLVLSGFTVVALMQMDVLPVVDSSDIPYEEIDHGNEGQWSESEAFDVFGRFILNENMNIDSNVDISKELNLKKGESQMWSLDIGSNGADTVQDTVVVEILNNSGTEFRYICEDITNNVELANFSSFEDINRVLSNLNPEHRYEVTVINLGITDLILDITVHSYPSGTGKIVLE